MLVSTRAEEYYSHYRHTGDSYLDPYRCGAFFQGNQLVFQLLVSVMFLAALPAWGGQPLQRCLSCHPAHYADRGTCSHCHRGNPASERKNIAHTGLRAGKFVRFTIGDLAQKKEGEHLMDQLGCRRCHITAGRGNALASNLDGAAARKTAKEIVLSIRQPVATMPKFGLDDERITILINMIFAGSEGRDMNISAPVKVHFNNSGNKSEDIFSKKCGSCHRVVTGHLGALGSGDIGPNLSGLFSPYYPNSFKNGGGWSAGNLGDWLKNPRDLRVWARMQPVILNEKEMAELVATFHVIPDAASHILK